MKSASEVQAVVVKMRDQEHYNRVVAKLEAKGYRMGNPPEWPIRIWENQRSTKYLWVRNDSLGKKYDVHNHTCACDVVAKFKDIPFIK